MPRNLSDNSPPGDFKISDERKTRYIVAEEVRQMTRENDVLEVPGQTAEEKINQKDGKCYTGPFITQKKIGATSYEVAVYFSQECRESFEDKIIRLVRNEALNNGTNL
jgi:hypothetical protein